MGDPADLTAGGGGKVGTVTVAEVTGVVTVTPGGGLVGTVGTVGTEGTGATVGTAATTPATVWVGEVETAEMADVPLTGWANSERTFGEDGSFMGATRSAPGPETARPGCRKTESLREPFRPPTAGRRSTLGAKSRSCFCD